MNVLLGVLSASEVLAVYWKLRVFNEVSNNALNVRSAKNAMLGRYWNGVIDGILGFLASPSPSFVMGDATVFAKLCAALLQCV